MRVNGFTLRTLFLFEVNGVGGRNHVRRIALFERDGHRLVDLALGKLKPDQGGSNLVIGLGSGRIDGLAVSGTDLDYRPQIAGRILLGARGIRIEIVAGDQRRRGERDKS
jgi:hypothetical protein